VSLIDRLDHGRVRLIAIVKCCDSVALQEGLTSCGCDDLGEGSQVCGVRDKIAHFRGRAREGVRRQIWVVVDGAY
jgi:hypothetical protein